VQGFSTPLYTKRIASAAHQALPHRPTGPCSAGLGISDPWISSSASPEPCSPRVPPLRPMRYALDLLSWGPTPQTHEICTGPGLSPRGLPSWQSVGIRDLCWVTPSSLHRTARSLLPWILPLRPAKPAIHTCTILVPLHRPAQSPLHQLVLLRPANWQSRSIHDLCSNRPAQSLICQAMPLEPAKLVIHTCTISAGTCP
jgi:hypothetical protein